MKIILEISSDRYYRFLGTCDPTSREYMILKNGAEILDPGKRTIIVLCEAKEAKRLLEAAKMICPEAAIEIATWIELTREP